jgi:hypothetical protein
MMCLGKIEIATKIVFECQCLQRKKVSDRANRLTFMFSNSRKTRKQFRDREVRE